MLQAAVQETGCRQIALLSWPSHPGSLVHRHQVILQLDAAPETDCDSASEQDLLRAGMHEWLSCKAV